ncbi:membrane frizzled-related protein-like isoform X1 [Triplophysa dalaica]|uniref:membrane frizzled-related protein-like isoform X1 n=1 Tax=Triplophysa dalaica TaxID=1582913 RepID=UPI0024DF9175|nr:membrane frizzled-related protein-like isoform X1 [Triplophysa dalaica]
MKSNKDWMTPTDSTKFPQNLSLNHDLNSSISSLPEKEPASFTECGGVLMASKGTLSSPNYPVPYPPYSNCVWVIRVSPPFLIQIYVSFLAVEGPSPCLFDWLEIKEETEKMSVATRFCGNVAPPTVNTNSSIVWVSFHSDGSIGGNGFIAQYHSILPEQKSCSREEFKCDSGRCLLPISVCDSHPNCLDHTDEVNCSQKHKDWLCGGKMTGKSGSLSSPNHPKAYPHKQVCTWEIFVENRQTIRLSFHNFSLETHDVCEFDYVEVYDGANTVDNTVLGRYCGSTVPPDLISSGPTMTVVFVTDEGVADSGFWASYQAISFSEKKCSPEQFSCSTGECLHKDWLCDGWRDCPDGADEHNCVNTSYPSFTSSCESIQVEICGGLSYNLTSFPNIWLSISDQKEAASLLQKYRMLMEFACFDALRQLVCGMFFPKCSPQSGVVKPCQSICSTAEQQCSEALNVLGLNWPFNCQLLPDSQDPMQCSLP